MKCPTHNGIECNLGVCNKEQTCQFAPNKPKTADEEKIFRVPWAKPSCVSRCMNNIWSAQTNEAQCNRTDCELAGYCRHGFEKHWDDVEPAQRYTKAQAEGDGAGSSASTVTTYGTGTVKAHTYVPAKPCHTGFTYIGSIGHAHIWVGRGSDATPKLMPDRHLAALAIDLTDNDRPPRFSSSTVRVSAEAQEFFGPLAQVYAPVPYINVAWPDFRAPKFLTREWWLELVEILRTNVHGDVMLYCVGGHGRTGTAAAILAALGGFLPEDQPDPVLWLRDIYCRQIVESDEQIDYIEEMTGLKLSCRPRDDLGLWDWPQGNTSRHARSAWGSYGKQPKAKPAKSVATQHEPSLSNKRYKHLFHKRNKERGTDMELGMKPFGALEDGDTVIVDGNTFMWSMVTRQFIYVRPHNPTELDNRTYIRERERIVTMWAGGDPIPEWKGPCVESDIPPRLVELKDGTMVCFHGEIFCWSGSKKSWSYVHKSILEPKPWIYIVNAAS